MTRAEGVKLLIVEKPGRLHFGFNSLNAELNPICHLLVLLGAHPFLHVSRVRVKHVLVWKFVVTLLF